MHGRKVHVVIVLPALWSFMYICPHFQGWFYACELYHFVRFIAKGKTKNVEALYCPQEAILFETDLWKQLRQQLPHSSVTGENTEGCCNGFNSILVPNILT